MSEWPKKNTGLQNDTTNTIGRNHRRDRRGENSCQKFCQIDICFGMNMGKGRPSGDEEVVVVATAALVLRKLEAGHPQDRIPF